MKIEFYPLLDEWISGLDLKAAVEILRLLKILRTEADLYGGDVLITPIKAFQEASLDQNTYESILFNLHGHEVIYAVNMKSIPTSENLNIRSGHIDSISDNIRIVNPLFRYVFSLLQIKVGDITENPKKLGAELKLKLQKLKSDLPTNRKYKMAKKFIDRIIEKEGWIPGYVFAQAIVATITNNNFKPRKLSKKDYLDRKGYYDERISNRLKTLNPLFEQVGHKLRLRNEYWILTSISSLIPTKLASKFQ